ncbi:hypothetical protein KJ633_05405 [bacterium]|nr:hypothetical protein [bacterium]MBU3955879.1 hypothetical protein [bacterium]MBU4134078.1 hypothetical protein [bacterium]
MKNLMNWTAAGMMLASAAAFSPVLGAASSPDDKNEMAEFKQWKKNKEQKGQKRDEQRKKMHEKRMDKLGKELDLSAAQREKISGILENSWNEVAKERKAFGEKVKNLRQESDKSIEKELTKEQIEKWKQCKQKDMRKNCKSMKNRKDKSQKKGGNSGGQSDSECNWQDKD